MPPPAVLPMAAPAVPDSPATLGPVTVPMGAAPRVATGGRSAVPLGPAARDAWARLRLRRGPGELRAMLLALVLTPGSSRERQCWIEETDDLDGAAFLMGDLETLPAHARLPALEAVLAHAALLPLADRQDLAPAVRRVMCADGRVRPLDRLKLLLVRHRLAGVQVPQRASLREADPDLGHLPLALRIAAADVSAFLARLVPQADPRVRVCAAGAGWHARVVTALWGSSPHPPACQVPDTDALVRALQTLRHLDWMRRPLLVRVWLDALHALAEQVGAPAASGGVSGLGGLDLDGAEALRIACGLLDTPVPPELSRLFAELPGAPAA
ncbi:hypothetical protein [Leptothrix discophora]|uniref:Uncharacterized protein n=1 Tax=Leptothrix discophora TaxID=89 RepID=A0ABT9G5T4_LEPDI|nr:hypothetical protein [Leptothrix discophora]MDP4301843.1 hypothetical protein [Leptothrix discophora]